MTLFVSAQIIGPNIHDASFVHIARRNQVAADQFAEPSCGCGVQLVVICGQGAVSDKEATLRTFEVTFNYGLTKDVIVLERGRVSVLSANPERGRPTWCRTGEFPATGARPMTDRKDGHKVRCHR